MVSARPVRPIHTVCPALVLSAVRVGTQIPVIRRWRATVSLAALGLPLSRENRAKNAKSANMLKLPVRPIVLSVTTPRATVALRVSLANTAPPVPVARIVREGIGPLRVKKSAHHAISGEHSPLKVAHNAKTVNLDELPELLVP